MVGDSEPEPELDGEMGGDGGTLGISVSMVELLACGGGSGEAVVFNRVWIVARGGGGTGERAADGDASAGGLGAERPSSLPVIKSASSPSSATGPLGPSDGLPLVTLSVGTFVTEPGDMEISDEPDEADDESIASLV